MRILARSQNFFLNLSLVLNSNSESTWLKIYILILIIVTTLLLSLTFSISVKLTPKIKNKVQNDSSFGNDYFERSILTNMRNDGYTASPNGSKNKTPLEVINVPTVIWAFLKVLNKLFEFTHYQIWLQLNIIFLHWIQGYYDCPTQIGRRCMALFEVEILKKI